MQILNEIKNINRNRTLCEDLQLKSLAKKHSDPFAFAKEVISLMRSGEITLKVRGAANTRELVIIWYKLKDKK